MKGDFHVRFCERLELQCFGLLNRITDELLNLISSSYLYSTTVRADEFQISKQHKALPVSCNHCDRTKQQHRQKNMDNSTSIRDAIWSQFGASLDMLENAINMCPDEHWDTALNFWYTSYHCIFWTDYYLTTEPSKFEPPTPFTFSEFDPTTTKPDRTYTKTELLSYLGHCRQKASQLISELTTDKLNERWINDYKNFSVLEILL